MHHLDFRNQDSLTGMKRVPEFSVSKYFDNDDLRTFFTTVERGEPIAINFTEWHGMAYVHAIIPKSASHGDFTKATVTFRPTGAPFNEQKKEQTMSPKNTKRPRFYVGSSKMSHDWPKHTMKEAIDHATALCEQTGDEQIVVQIIRRIHRKPQPIVVEVVRG